MGHSYEHGSIEETLAMSALKRRNRVDLLTTMSLISAIMVSGNRVAAAVSGNNPPDSDSLTKITDELRGLLIPEIAEELEKKTETMKEKLLKETNSGPMYIRAPEKKQKGRFVRKRRQ